MTTDPGACCKYWDKSYSAKNIYVVLFVVVTKFVSRNEALKCDYSFLNSFKMKQNNSLRLNEKILSLTVVWKTGLN